jgi:hypothetical protein
MEKLTNITAKDKKGAKDADPSIILFIYTPKYKSVGLSWSITISVPGELDYVFDIIPTKKEFVVREERHPPIDQKSQFFKAAILAAINVGTVPSDSYVKQYGLGHAAKQIKEGLIDHEKPKGMSTIWVVDVLGKLKRQGFVIYRNGAEAKIEKQVRALEKEMKSS